jgi:hypothetical protein
MRIITLLGALAAAAVLTGAALAGEDDGVKTWRITLTNLTPATGPGASQPLSPPLVAVHSTKADAWSVGSVASAGVAAIAEDADTAPLTVALTGAPGVRSVTTVPKDNGAGVPPVVFPGSSLTFEVTTRGEESRLTLLSMLVNTNDGFTGLDSLLLQGQGGTLALMAYDAGSEANNEDAGFIPGPCCGSAGVRDATVGPIAPHPGIAGTGDLDPMVYGWSGAVARVTYERVS